MNRNSIVILFASALLLFCSVSSAHVWEGTIDYPVDEDSLFTDYMSNELSLSRIDTLATSMSADVDSIVITGTASPEGKEQYNIELASKRVLTFRDYLINNYPQLDSTTVRTTTHVFMWEELLDTLKADTLLADSAAVLKILESEHRSNLNKTWTLRTHYQDSYHYINDTYLKYLRQGSVKVFYRSAVPVLAVPQQVTQDTVCNDTVCNDTVVRRRELMSVKTNLLYYGAYIPGYDKWCPIPNVQIEFYPRRGHFTYGLSLEFPWWSDYDAHKYFQIRNYQFDTRYYFRGHDDDINRAAFKGTFVNAYVHAGLGSICFDANRGWIGEGLGAGLGIGYVLPVGKSQHWRLEFAAQFGAVWCRYDKYQYESPVEPREHDNLYYYKWTGDAELFRERMYRWLWIGPTRIAISLSTDMIFRKSDKKDSGK